MANPTDPSVVVAASRCFDTCIPPGDQDAVKTFLLAKIAGVTDPGVVMTNARCFNSCFTAGGQLFIQAYLATLLSGQSSDPSTIANDARCFSSCVPSGALAAVVNYSLALKAGGSMDPSALANQARCFSSCIPPGFQTAGQTYLMAVAAGQSTDPQVLQSSKGFAQFLGTLPRGLPQMILGDAIFVYAGGGTGTKPGTPTGFSFAFAANLSVVNVSWDALPAGATSTEIWTSTDNITFVLESSVSSPATSTTSAGPSNGVTKYCKIRWCNIGGCSSFTTAQSVVGTLTSAWAGQVVTNGGAAASVATVTALQTFEGSLAPLLGRIHHLNVIAPDNLIAALTPFIHNYGNSLWTKISIGVPPAESLTINGLKSSTNDTNGIVYDTGVVPNAIASFTPSFQACSVYCADAVITNSANAMVGCFDSVLSYGLLNIPQLSPGGNAYMSAGKTSNGCNIAHAAIGGYYSCSRLSATSLTTWFANSTNIWGAICNNAVSDPALSLNTQNVCAGGSGIAGASASPCAISRFSFMAVHDGFNLVDGQTLFNAVQALRVAFGGGSV